MQNPKLLLFLLLSLTLTHATYELIELGLTVDTPSCATTTTLLQAAEVDSLKLVEFKSQLERRISFLQSSRKEAQEACDKIPEASVTYLASTPPVHKSSKKSPLQFSELLHPVNSSSSKAEKEVSSHLQKASLELAQLHSGNYQNIEACKMMQTKIGDLVIYLQGVVGELVPAIEKYMPERKENIKNLEAACSQGHTRTGTWSFTYAGHEFAADSGLLRSEDYNIAFDVPFAETPEVAVAIKSFDIDKRAPGVSVIVTDRASGSFTIRVFAYPNAKINMLEVSWLATISSMSGIYVSNFNVDYKEDIEWSKKYQGTSERTMKVTAFHPTALSHPEIVIGISSFFFEGGADGRVSIEAQNVDEKGGELLFKTWWNTTLYMAEVNTLHYSKDNLRDKKTVVSSVQGGALFNAVGDRKEENKILLIEGESNPMMWMGLKKMDVKFGKNYKFKMDGLVQEAESKKLIDVKLSTWDDCSIWQVSADVFFVN